MLGRKRLVGSNVRGKADSHLILWQCRLITRNKYIYQNIITQIGCYKYIMDIIYHYDILLRITCWQRLKKNQILNRFVNSPRASREELCFPLLTVQLIYLSRSRLTRVYVQWASRVGEKDLQSHHKTLSMIGPDTETIVLLI